MSRRMIGLPDWTQPRSNALSDMEVERTEKEWIIRWMEETGGWGNGEGWNEWMGG